MAQAMLKSFATPRTIPFLPAKSPIRQSLSIVRATQRQMARCRMISIKCIEQQAALDSSYLQIFRRNGQRIEDSRPRVLRWVVDLHRYEPAQSGRRQSKRSRPPGTACRRALPARQRVAARVRRCCSTGPTRSRTRRPEQRSSCPHQARRRGSTSCPARPRRMTAADGEAVCRSRRSPTFSAAGSQRKTSVGIEPG